MEYRTEYKYTNKYGVVFHSYIDEATKLWKCDMSYNGKIFDVYSNHHDYFPNIDEYIYDNDKDKNKLSDDELNKPIDDIYKQDETVKLFDAILSDGLDDKKTEKIEKKTTKNRKNSKK